MRAAAAVAEAGEAPAAVLAGVTVRYPFATADAVGPVDIEIARGERVLLLGPSGSGKSTLLLTLTGLLPDHVPAEVGGSVALFGAPVSSATAPRRVAQLFQDSDQTLCGMSVEEEIAFPLENRGLPEAEISARVGAAMAALELPESWRRRASLKLSGGERQLVALASALVQDADLLVVDEPAAHLSPEAAARFHCLLAAPQTGRTVLVVDHRFDGLIAHIDRIVALGRAGRVVADGPPRRVLREDAARLSEAGVWLPASATLDALLVAARRAVATPPLSVADALPPRRDAESEAAVRTFLAGFAPPTASAKESPHPEARAQRASKDEGDGTAPATGRSLPGSVLSPVVRGSRLRRSHLTMRGGEGEAVSVGRRSLDDDPHPPVVTLTGADCAPFLAAPVLRNISLALHAGEVAVLAGPNGAGKTTLAATLAGVLPLKAGRRDGPPGGIAFQKPESQFLAGRVDDELAAALPKRMPKAERAARIAAALARAGLAGFEGRHPFELSEGEKRRLALAALTITDRWPLIVLDEPTAGLDAAAAATLATEIRALRHAGKAVLVVTHDLDFAAPLADRLIVVAGGGILADGEPRAILADAELLAAADLRPPAYVPAARWLEEAAC